MLNNKILLKYTYCICGVICLRLKTQIICKDFNMADIDYDGIFVL